MRVRAGAAAACALLGVTLAAAAQAAALPPFTVVGDAIPASLTGMPGDAEILVQGNRWPRQQRYR